MQGILYSIKAGDRICKIHILVELIISKKAYLYLQYLMVMVVVMSVNIFSSILLKNLNKDLNTNKKIINLPFKKHSKLLIKN
jgi:hypothetical protein